MGRVDDAASSGIQSANRMPMPLLDRIAGSLIILGPGTGASSDAYDFSSRESTRVPVIRVDHAGVGHADSRDCADCDARREPARERPDRDGAAGPGSRTGPAPHSSSSRIGSCSANPELDADDIQGKAFQAEVVEDESGRWIVTEIAFASGRVLRAARVILIRNALEDGASRLGPRPGDHPAIELAGSGRRRRGGRTPRRSAGGPRRRAGGPRPGLRAARGGCSTRPRRSASPTRRPVRPSSIRSVLPPIPRDDAGQGGGHRLQERVAHPLGHAGQDEEVGRAEVFGGVVDRAGELDPVGDAQRPGQLGEPLAIVARPDQDQVGRRPPSDLGPGLEQEREVLLGMEPAGEDHARARQQLASTALRPGAEVLGVDAAGHPDHPRRRRPRAPATAARSRPRSRRRPCWPGWPGGAGRHLASGAARRPRRSSPSWPAGPASACRRGADAPARSPRPPRAPDACGSRRSRRAAAAAPPSRPRRSSGRTGGRPSRS